MVAKPLLPTWILAGMGLCVPPRSATSVPLMKTKKSSSPQTWMSNAPLKATRARASIENQESWNHPCMVVTHDPVEWAANETLGGKRYWSALQPAPAPKAVLLYQ